MENIKSTLVNFIGEEWDREVLQGIYFDKENGKAVASNGRILAVWKSETPIERSFIQKPNGEEIEGKYPAYTVIEGACKEHPNNKTLKNPREMLEYLQEKYAEYESADDDRDEPVVSLFGIPVAVGFLSTIIKVFLSVGDEEIRVLYYDRYSPLKFTGDSALTCYLMGCRVKTANCIKEFN